MHKSYETEFLTTLSKSDLASVSKEGDGRPPGDYFHLDVWRISPGTSNVRKSPGDVSELVQSIKQKGILEPLMVRPLGRRYELVLGSRRFEAAKILGMKMVPVVIRQMSKEDALLISLMENIQRRQLEPEEEYDGMMQLKKIAPERYSTSDQLAKAIGKSRQYVEDRINAVEAVRAIRKTGNAQIEVKQSPTQQERREGILPIKHATFLHKAEEAPALKRLSEERRTKKLTELAETIAELPRPQAEKIVEHFVMAPQKPIEDLRNQVDVLRSVKLEILLDPRVADRLRRAAEDRKATMEAMASLALNSWLRQQGY